MLSSQGLKSLYAAQNIIKIRLPPKTTNKGCPKKLPPKTDPKNCPRGLLQSPEINPAQILPKGCPKVNISYLAHHFIKPIFNCGIFLPPRFRCSMSD